MFPDAPDAFLSACGMTGPIRLALERPELGGAMNLRFHQPFLVIGSGPDADVRLDHPDVSRRHAYLQALAGRIFCSHLQSRTGIQRVKGAWSKGWLRPGDVIGIGPFLIGWDQEDGPGAPAGPGPDDDWPAPTSRAFERPGLAEAALEFLGDSERPSPWRLSRALVLCGRSPVCKVRLAGNEVSSFHCSLLRTLEGVWVVDLLSRAGTIVNGRRVRFARLSEGDLLEVGGHRIRLAAVPGGGVPRLPVRRDDRPAAVPAVAHPASRPDPLPSADWLAGSDVALRLVVQELGQIQQHGADPVAWPTGSDVALRLAVQELGQMQQQNADRFQQVLLMVCRLFSEMHREQMDLIRDELGQLHRLAEKERALESELAHQSGQSAHGPGPTLRLVTGDLSPPPTNGRPRHSSTRGEAEPSVKTARPAGGTVRPASLEPMPDAGTTHSQIVERIAAIQRERQTRWQKLLGSITGRPGVRPGDDSPPAP